MTDSEKKAIESLKDIVNKVNPFDMSPSEYIKYKTILNLIENQENAINKMTEQIRKNRHNFCNNIKNCYCEKYDISEDNCRACIKNYYLNSSKEDK